MKVVVEGLGFTQEFRAEDDISDSIFFADGLGVSDRNGGLDHHEDIGIYLQGPFNGVFDSAGIEEMIDVIIIGGCGDDHEISGAVSGCLVRGRVKMEGAGPFPGFAEETLDLIILYRAEELVEFLRFFLCCGNGRDFMLLGEQDGKAQADISYSGNCNLHSL